MPRTGGNSENCYNAKVEANSISVNFTNDIKEKVVDESTGTEKEVWKYNNGYPILKWQLQENQVAE